MAHVSAPKTTVFRHETDRDGRRLTLLSRAADLEIGQLPSPFKAADFALLCPDAPRSLTAPGAPAPDHSHALPVHGLFSRSVGPARPAAGVQRLLARG